jgi:hypothetical protein
MVYEKREVSFGYTIEEEEKHVRPFLVGHLAQPIDDLISSWPWQVRLVSIWPALDIIWSVLEDKVAVTFGEAFTIEHESVKELTTGERHNEPAAPPLFAF